MSKERRDWEVRAIWKALDPFVRFRTEVDKADNQKIIFPVRTQVPRNNETILLDEIGWEAYEWQRR